MRRVEVTESAQFEEGPASHGLQSCSDAKRQLEFLEEHSSSLSRVRGTHPTPFRLAANLSKVFQELMKVTGAFTSLANDKTLNSSKGHYGNCLDIIY